MRRGMLLISVVLMIGCTDASQYQQAIAVLVDVSGTYSDETEEVAKILKREVLPGLFPGDTLLLIRIDSESYQKENLEVLMTFDPRPSRANAQKLAIANKLDTFAATETRSKHTDIRGALMLAADYLREIDSGSRVILIFSDLREDLPAGTKRELGESEFDGIELATVNMKRLNSDNADPRLFRGRIASWERSAMQHGAAGWRSLMDSSRLPDYLAAIR